MNIRRLPRMGAGRALATLFALAAVAALTACAADRDPPSGQPSFYRSLAQPGAKLDADAARSMISGYRQNNGLGALTIDPELMRLAERQAQAMAARDKLSHEVGGPFTARLKKAGYHTIAEAFSGWRESPPHRANRLLKGATRMGIAAVYTPSSKYKVYWSLILARPADEGRS